jgi:hypothetical protein
MPIAIIVQAACTRPLTSRERAASYAAIDSCKRLRMSRAEWAPSSAMPHWKEGATLLRRVGFEVFTAVFGMWGRVGLL